MAIVECNNCFADGIQAISGCTFGNNAMIYKDLGKTAVTFYRREDDSGVRFMVNPPDEHSDEDPVYKEAMELFDRGVKKREKLTPEEYSRMNELWTQMSFGVLEKDEKDIFIVQDVVPEGLEYAPIFDSATCSKCGEQAMETRTRLHEGSPVCIRCIGEDYWMVAGRGIHPVKGKSAV
jgi:formylmethanofuran dehydrogenase subunit E